MARHRARSTPGLDPVALTRQLRRAWRGVAWYVQALLGQSDYQAWVDHLRRYHPDQPIPTVAGYWRQRYRWESRHPGARCC
jgi:uncharacterized short protein YbdD (DUF466 family)